MKYLYFSLLTLITFFISAETLQAQDDSPVTALDKIDAIMNGVSKKYVEYMSVVAHSDRVRKAERKYNEYLKQLDEARYAIIDVPYYKGDKSLHTASINCLKLENDVMNENYSKIVNLDEIAEQSYDNMEAYILMKKKVKEKMHEAFEKSHQAVIEYCKKYNITLSEEKDELGIQMSQLNDVMDYYDKLHLIFFKCSVEEKMMMDALDKKNVTTLEQIKSTMVRYADEGIAKLDTTPDFKNSAALKSSCVRGLNFFKTEAAKLSAATDFLIKNEAFNKIKNNFENNPSAQSNKDEVDKYNKAVAELNKALNLYNDTNQTLNQKRKDVYTDWNGTIKTFMDAYTPYATK